MAGEFAGIGGDVICDDAIDLYFARTCEAPAHPAVVVDGRSLSYAALVGLARRLAAVFARIAEPRFDKVSAQMKLGRA